MLQFDTIVSVVISLLGFIVTYLSLKKEFRNSISISLYNDKKELYFDVYVLIDELSENRDIIFSDNFWKKFKSAKIKMSLLADKEVLKLFNDFYSSMKQVKNGYDKFCEENVWEKCKQVGFDNDIHKLSMKDLIYIDKQYKKAYMPDEAILKEKINFMLKSMKHDLKTDK